MVKIPGKTDSIVPTSEKKDNLDLITNPSCKACKSPMRLQIDLLMAKGYATTEIHRRLQEAGEDVSYSSLANHKNKHLSFDQKAYAAIVEKNIEEYQRIEGEETVRIVSGYAFLEAFINKGYDALIDGDIKIEGRDIVKAVEIKSTMDKDGVGEFQAQIMIRIESIRQAMEEVLEKELARSIIERAKVIADHRLRGEDPPARGEEVLVLEAENVTDPTDD